jgi:hypothetical protein
MVMWLAAAGSAQDKMKSEAMQDCPMHQQHANGESHAAVVEKHGDQAMGFSHEATTHHFRLLKDGGAIEAAANDPKDEGSVSAIRSHLSDIAKSFAEGNFSTPMFIHDGIPPGTTAMKLLKDKIRYRYEELPLGGRLRIEATDPLALAAIHDFLRFQITEHHTGDSLEGAVN